MIRKIYLFLTAFIAFGFAAFAQNNPGSIKVTLVDEKGEEIPFANVVVYSGATQLATGTTDIEGNAFIKQLAPGKYDVKAVYVGYQTKTISGVVVSNDKVTYLKIPMTGGVQLDEVVVKYEAPLIDPNTISGGTVTRESYMAMADKSIAGVLSTQAGVYANNDGDLNLRGGRNSGGGAGIDGSSAANNIFIDGERVIGTANVARGAVSQMSVILGGVPAQYGDVTSGVVSITTRGAAPTWSGGVEGQTSQLTDKFGYNYLGFNVGGPVLQKKDSAGGTRPLIGVFLSGEVEYQKDPRPWATGIYQVNKDKLSSLEQHPLVYNPLSNNYYLAAAYMNASDLHKSAVRPNVASRGIRLNPKVDFAINPNLNITLGGSWDYTTNHTFIMDYALLNSKHNPQIIQNTMRGYARLTQHFGPSGASEQEKSQSIIKNAFLTAQVSYQKYKWTQQDEQFKDRLFDYGYNGKFTEYQMPYYAISGATQAHNLYTGHDTTVGSATTPVYVFAGYIDSLITFSPGSQNALTANYTSQLMDYYGAQGTKVWNYGQIYQNNGLRNGDVPQNVHALWFNTGRAYGGYQIRDQRMFRFTSNFTADIKNHSIVVGVEFDQRNESGFFVSTRSLWNSMRQLANMHNQNVDTASLVYHDAGSMTVTNFNPYGSNYTDNTLGVVTGDVKYDPSAQSVFSKNFYDQIGVAGDHSPSSTKYINIDEVDPSKLSLGMFSPDELLNGGIPLVDAYGYDYTGKRLKQKVSFNDFLDKTHSDKFGDKLNDRLVGAFRPVYMAGYIQDRFDFKDIKFNVGVRIDRYDANQMVLKDKYLLFDAMHVGDLTGSAASQVPSSVPKDAVVYVTDAGTKNIAGYRSGDNWYDASGNAVSDPKIIGELSGGQALPWLVKDEDYKKSGYSNSAFTAYKPQINVMPRVAFSFPISDVANFFAHYDILTERPQSGTNRMDPKDWYYLSANQGGIYANPNLKSQRTVDYELGFSQLLNEKKSASLEISAFYREMRNLINIIRVNQAYPLSYLTYGNIDFQTVKGFSAAFKMRRTNGVQFSVNYTLQFAEGSGSNASSGANLASSSQPNLRVLIPLDFDQRHTLAANFDYRFFAGKDYKGPQSTIGGKTIRWLENSGVNIVPRIGSGTPYTRRYPPKSDVEIGNNITQSIYGDLNGSRLPWQFKTDMRIDKSFNLTLGKTDGDKKAKISTLNIYFQILNVFNTKNIIQMHNYTGSATDDGYLTSNIGLNEISQKAVQGAAYSQSFQDLYKAKLNDGSYFSIPRQFRIGIQWDFQ
ncbi:MAG: carboxypeptidase regulatory-like domain-containing protein [Bacteroidia bacterium]